MTPVARLLGQQPALRRAAFDQTGDSNEAFLLVHCVMTVALGQIGGPEQDLASAMSNALDRRTRRLACTAAV